MNISALCNPFRQLFSRESHSTKKTSGSTKIWNPETESRKRKQKWKRNTESNINDRKLKTDFT